MAARFLTSRSCSAGLSQRSGQGLYSRLDIAARAFAAAQAIEQSAQQGECLTYRVSLEDIQAAQKVIIHSTGPAPLMPAHQCRQPRSACGLHMAMPH